MPVVISPFCPQGALDAIPSKSETHRMILSAALAQGETQILAPAQNADIASTIACLNNLGASITWEGAHLRIRGLISLPKGEVLLPAGESGATYRFLAPVVSALGLNGRFQLSGRLPHRPMDELFEAMSAHGVTISKSPSSGAESAFSAEVTLRGQLRPGSYVVSGHSSSQFLSGLLFALPLLPEASTLSVAGKLVSRPYLNMTLDTLEQCAIPVRWEGSLFRIPSSPYRPPRVLTPGGDWSNAAILLAAGAARGGVTLRGLRQDTQQGDRAICQVLREFGATVIEEANSVTVSSSLLRGIHWDLTHTPDLAPAIAVAAVAAQGITQCSAAHRIRQKESNRVESICQVVRGLGASAWEENDTLFIQGRGNLAGGTVFANGDHRIAMMAAAMAVISRKGVLLQGADSVQKSQPTFFQDLRHLGADIREVP